MKGRFGPEAGAWAAPLAGGARGAKAACAACNGLRRPPLPPDLGRAAAGAEAWPFRLRGARIPRVFQEVDVKTEPFLPPQCLRP